MQPKMSYSQESYIIHARELFKKIIPVSKSKMLTPRHKFFKALIDPSLLALFISSIGLRTKNEYFDEWQCMQDFLRYYSSLIFTLKTTKQGNKYIVSHNFDIHKASSIKWGNAIKALLGNFEMKKVFIKCAQKRMQSLFPELTTPIRLILNRLFQDKKELFGYDFGCGLNIDLPLLVTSYLPYRYKIPHELKRYDHPVHIEKAIGVDIHKPDLEWAKVCSSSEVNRDINKYIRLSSSFPNPDSFAFKQSDIFKFRPDYLADFIITKRMRYQFLEKDQSKIIASISRSLRIGGYWITVGEEDYFSKPNLSYFQSTKSEIWVYQNKTKGLLKITSHPVIEFSQKSRQIVDFNKQFFSYQKEKPTDHAFVR